MACEGCGKRRQRIKQVVKTIVEALDPKRLAEVLYLQSLHKTEEEEESGDD